jgi:uncharacterized membrane protein
VDSQGKYLLVAIIILLMTFGLYKLSKILLLCLIRN